VGLVCPNVATESATVKASIFTANRMLSLDLERMKNKFIVIFFFALKNRSAQVLLATKAWVIHTSPRRVPHLAHLTLAN